jgi:hypothetical protein
MPIQTDNRPVRHEGATNIAALQLDKQLTAKTEWRHAA